MFLFLVVLRFIFENEIMILKDGNLLFFNIEEMIIFFCYMGVEDKIVNYL